MGRKQALVRLQFVACRGGRLKCRNCSFECSAESSSTRLQEHLDECEKYQSRTSTLDKDIEPPPHKKLVQTEIPTGDEKDRLDLLVTKAWISCGFSFHSIGNPDVIEMFHALRRNYHPPDRKILSGKLLDHYEETVKRRIDPLLGEAKAIVLQSDGWSNVHQENIVGYVAAVQGKKIFLADDEITSARHDGEFIARGLREWRNKLGQARTFCIMTDNASSMKRAWEILRGEDKTLITIGCYAHTLNLVVCDLLHKKSSPGRSIADEANELVKRVTKGRLQELLGEYQERIYGRRLRMQVPGKTRWGSYIRTFSVLLRSKRAIRGLAGEEGFEGSACALRDQFWNDLALIAEALRPIFDLTIFAESDHSLLCDLFPLLSSAFQYESSQLVNPWCAHVRQSLIDRLKPTYNRVMMAAFVLCPRHSHKVCATDRLAFAEFLKEYRSEEATLILNQYEKYEKKVESFSRLTLWELARTADPYYWWDNYVSPESCPQLRNLALQLLMIPCSTASVERIWKCHSFFWTKYRSELSPEKIQKLVRVKSFLTQQSQSTRTKSTLVKLDFAELQLAQTPEKFPESFSETVGDDDDNGDMPEFSSENEYSPDFEGQSAVATAQLDEDLIRRCQHE